MYREDLGKMGMGSNRMVGAVLWLSFGWAAGRLTAALSQVLSHNLYTVLHIPHDPVALEEHFRDDDDGPVSSQGYMPYLNKYILDKVGPSVREAPLTSPHFLAWPTPEYIVITTAPHYKLPLLVPLYLPALPSPSFTS